MRRLLVAGLLALVPVLAACGDDGDDKASSTTQDGTSNEGASAEVTVAAEDLAFAPKELEASAGDIEVTLTNEGQIEHNWSIEGRESDLKLDTPQNGDTDTGTITLPAGTYTYYCDVAGHRSAGMEGTLTVG